MQIARLEQTWMVLRQRHTEGAILYEKKLKPFLKSLNEGKGNESGSQPRCLLPPGSAGHSLVAGMCLRAASLPQQRQTLPSCLLRSPSTRPGPLGLSCPFLPKEAFHN